MIRKSTGIVLVVFIVLLAAAFYLSKNPLPKTASVSATPTSAPAQPPLLQGWNEADINYIEIRGAGDNLTLSQNVNGGWTLAPNNNKALDAGKVENLRSQIVALQATITLNPVPAADQLGIASPSNVITVRNKQGKQAIIKVGKATPTGSGYYVQVDSNPPVVVSQYGMEAVLGLLKADALIATTPTPEVTGTPITLPTATP